MTDTLREAATRLIEHKGPCLDGVVRHVGEDNVCALEAALAATADAPEGPWDVVNGVMRWHVQRFTEQKNRERVATFDGSTYGRKQAEAVRDTLNRLHAKEG